jgi:lipopolysaccharide export system permease protein
VPKLLYLYLAKRIALAAVLIELSLCIPVVMTSIFHYLPPTAVRGGLLWPALLGTLPTVLYIALPIAIGVAIMLEFSRMASEGMIAVLYSLRLSVWSICAPFVAVSLIAVGIGYAISSFIAPAYVGQMHDVIYVIRNSLNHRMLEPAHFYTFGNGSETLYFERWRTPDVALGMFIHQFDEEKKEERIITAASTEFRRNERGVVLVMSNGSIQTRAEGSPNVRGANFDEYVMPIDMQGTGGMPKRNWRGVFEYPGLAFFQQRSIDARDPHQLAEWTSEATKRTAIPLLSFVHAVFGIALVLTVSSATGRGSSATTLAILAVPAAHIAILIGAETLTRKSPALVWVVALAILAELAAGLFMLQRLGAVRRVPGDDGASLHMRAAATG